MAIFSIDIIESSVIFEFLQINLNISIEPRSFPLRLDHPTLRVSLRSRSSFRRGARYARVPPYSSKGNSISYPTASIAASSTPSTFSSSVTLM